jgi:hypothetical protein
MATENEWAALNCNPGYEITCDCDPYGLSQPDTSSGACVVPKSATWSRNWLPIRDFILPSSEDIYSVDPTPPPRP